MPASRATAIPGDARGRARLELGLAALACALVGWFVWSPIAGGAWFFADDWEYIRSFVREDYALHLGELLPWASGRHRALDRTLKTFLFVRFGFDAAADHFVQLGLHVTTSILLFALVRRLVPLPGAAWLAAAVFVLNRFTIHAVGWFSLLHDDLTACLAVVVLLCWVRSWRPDGTGGAWVACAVVAFALGLKAKEGIILLPPLAMLASALFRPAGVAAGREAARIGVLAVVAVVFYACAPRFVAPDAAQPYFQSFHPSVVSRSFWWYASQLAFLSDATRERLVHLPAPFSIVGMAVVVAMPWLALVVPGAASRALVFGWTMLWLMLLPTAALPNHYDYPYYVYTPMVGGAIAFGGMVGTAATVLARSPLGRRGHVAAVAAGAALVVWAHVRTQTLPEIGWYPAVGREAHGVMQRLTESLPSVPPHSRVVLVNVAGIAPFRFLVWYPAGPSAVVQAWYRDSTLDVVLPDAPAPPSAGANGVVLAWNGERFERR